MKKKLPKYISICITGICVLFCMLISVRLFAKEILVDRLHIRNEWVSTIADYYWLDQLSQYPAENTTPGYSEQYASLRDLQDSAKLALPAHAATAAENGTVWDPYTEKISEFENDIDHYCNYHFLLRPFFTEAKINTYSLFRWNMVYARSDESEYMLNNGFVYRAAQKETSVSVDTTVKEAADRHGSAYLFVQYPFRVTENDPLVPYGAENYGSENATLRLDAYRAAGIDTLDLREGLTACGWDKNNGFYMTDGHWTTDSGFLSAAVLANYLSEHYAGFTCHASYYDPSNYDILPVDLNNPMIDEKVNIYLPKFETAFHLIRINDEAEKNIELDGTFSECVYDLNKADGTHFANVLTAYSASNFGGGTFTELENRMSGEHYGTVIVFSNSYSWHMLPYLAMEFDKLYFIHTDMKESAEIYIDALQPDLIIEAVN